MANEATMATTKSSSLPWARVYLKAVAGLVLGLAAGYVSRGWKAPTSAPATVPRVAVPTVPQGHGAAGRMPTLAEMKVMADKQAEPLLEKLKTDPGNTSLLLQVGALYHTTHQFKEAAAYYGKAAQADPKNVAIRTKLASSLYRSGDVDGAISQLNQALKYEPKDANALYDLGMIKLQGKQDPRGALAAWQRLLKLNPQLSEDRKAMVQKVMATALTMVGDQTGMQGARSNDAHRPNSN